MKRKMKTEIENKKIKQPERQEPEEVEIVEEKEPRVIQNVSNNSQIFYKNSQGDNLVITGASLKGCVLCMKDTLPLIRSFEKTKHRGGRASYIG